MDGQSIELPGEACPLNHASLHQTLVSAASNNQQYIHTGTKQLETWESHKGFHALLQDAFIEKSLPIELRLLSLIKLRHGVDKHWRKTNGIFPIEDDEKSKIRSRLLSSILNEESERLVSLNAHLASRIARADFPKDWRNPIGDIAQAVREAADEPLPSTRLMNVLEMGLRLVKELSTIRIGWVRTPYQSAAPELVMVLGTVYLARIKPWLQAMRSKSGSTDQVIPSMLITAKLLKVLRRLVVSGCKDPQSDKMVKTMWQLSVLHSDDFIELLSQPSLDTTCRTLLMRHVLHFVKLHLCMARDLPVSFCMLPESQDIVLKAWNHAKAIRQHQQKYMGQVVEDDTFYDDYNLRVLLLLRGCFKIAYGPTASSVEGIKTKMREVFLTDAFVKDLFENILNKFFVCISTDLEEWFADAEEWEMKEEGTEDAYDLSVRPCAERLFLDVVINRKSLTEEPLREIAQNVSANADPIIKDALYSALGVAAACIANIMDFDELIAKNLVNDLKLQGPNQNVLRRRIAILLSQWARVNIGDAVMPLVYQIYQHLLDPSIPLNDEAVRITAGKRFSEVVIVWNFKAKTFSPYAPHILSHLATLVSEVSLIETKLSLLSTLGAVIERMELQVGSLADQIISLLPPLWEESASEPMLKKSIVTLLTHMVEALKAKSAPLHGMVIPIIKDALEPSSETRTFLLEDALDLYSQILIQSREPSPEILSLIPLLIPILEMENEPLESALKITESLVLLASVPILIDDTQRVALLTQLTALMKVKKSRISTSATFIIDLLIRAAEALNGDDGVDAVVSGLMDTGLLPEIVNSFAEDWKAREKATPQNHIPHTDHRRFPLYIIILSRIIMGNPRALSRMMQSWSHSSGEDYETTMSSLVDSFLYYMDHIVLPTEKKLLCMALATLLQSGEKCVLRKLEGMISVWCSVVLEIFEDEETYVGDSLVYTRPAEEPIEDSESPEDMRRRNVMYSDPIHIINLRDYIKNSLQIAANKDPEGHAVFYRKWVESYVDPGTWNLFVKYGLAP